MHWIPCIHFDVYRGTCDWRMVKMGVVCKRLADWVCSGWVGGYAPTYRLPLVVAVACGGQVEGGCVPLLPPPPSPFPRALSVGWAGRPHASTLYLIPTSRQKKEKNVYDKKLKLGVMVMVFFVRCSQ